MRRLAALVATIAVGLTACTGGDEPKKKGKDDTARALPVPAKAPTARGPATGPALQPKVLLAASDELEKMASGSSSDALVERRSGAFVSGRTIVGYSVDDLSGYDLASGEQKWTADLDMGTGGVCFVSQPDRAVKSFTVAYGADSYCSDLATISVADGKVLSTSKRLSDVLNAPAEFDGPSGGAVDHLFTVGGRDHIVDTSGAVWKMAKGEPQPVVRLEADSYDQLHTTPEGDVLIGTRSDNRGRCHVDGYALPSFKHLWTADNGALFPEVRDDCLISAAPGNAAWLVQQADGRVHMAQVDPLTGKVLGRDDAASDSGGRAPEGQLDVASAANQLDRALGLPGGDTIFAQVRGLSRYSLETGKMVWDLDLSQLELDSEEDYPLTTVLPQGVTPDGHVLASVSNNTGVEIVAADVKTGKLAARWPVPAEYRNGFQTEPGMTLFAEGVVLTRNFDAWRRAFTGYAAPKEPKGGKYDIGVFTYPQPDSSAARAVPTAGPTDTDVEVLGGVETPPRAANERHAGALSTGSTVVTYAGNVVTGLDPASGKQKWTLQVDDAKDARVCSAAEPDRDVKTFTIAYRSGGERAECDALLRVNAADGTVIDRLDLPRGAKRVSQMIVHDGVVLIVTGDSRVSRIQGGQLVPVARLARQPYQVERTPEDPSLLISTSKLQGGRDWAIDAYRMPGFERVWSTKAKKVLSKVDVRNPIWTWRGNGLWISTTFGDMSDPEGTVKDALVALDPATGRVVGRSGSVKRDYLADDLATFSLWSAVSSSHVSVGFDDGEVIVLQPQGVVRYSLRDREARWRTSTSSIKDSMERDRLNSLATERIDLVDGGKAVLVTMSNGVSVEVMTLDAASGKITGRWNVPKEARNGLQAGPDVTPFDGGFALTRNDYSWSSAYDATGRRVPADPLHDAGLFALPKPKEPKKE
ncbi:PQQ-binding-like beta-propeller repeat protein [Aeromicrobium sp. SMF47]|uniref:outer membrane protein assembly factor BamB family protein n=1 Tax=Aeromicrobium TaxID=2040 RepID=UPI00129EBE88|nr:MULTISPECIES: PQQ-binding-like beta-propeller repeat protein [Aeromicrobium]MRJ77779.1 PQQ-binding-like beta-propeller repeat protein [Aeromicrobium yanjiei]MRK02148.1 PQQ-binding-like beta-propeller repeat protein [Aeromicrobium sp. S22]